MDITELQQVQPHTLLRFISGLRIGPNVITASAQDRMLSSPEVKVKVKAETYEPPKGRSSSLDVNIASYFAPQNPQFRPKGAENPCKY